MRSPHLPCFSIINNWRGLCATSLIVFLSSLTLRLNWSTEWMSLMEVSNVGTLMAAYVEARGTRDRDGLIWNQSESNYLGFQALRETMSVVPKEVSCFSLLNGEISIMNLEELLLMTEFLIRRTQSSVFCFSLINLIVAYISVVFLFHLCPLGLFSDSI